MKLLNGRDARRLITGLAIGAMLVMATPAVAEVAAALQLGKVNSSDARTTLTGATADDAMLRVRNKHLTGTGIDINVRSGQAPLTVNSSRKVKKLNADKLDGKSIRSFMLAADWDTDGNDAVDDADKLAGYEVDAFVKKEGSFSCAGTTFAPTSNVTDHTISASMLYRSANTGLPRFRCSVNVPDGATVTQVTFAVRDTDATNNVTNCEMWRTDMTGTIGSEQNMASAPATVGTPGNTTVTDTSINSAVINNGRYSYFVQCALNGTNSSIGLYGAIVTYEYDAAPAAADVTAPTAPSDGS